MNMPLQELSLRTRTDEIVPDAATLIAPQPGPQYEFLNSRANIVIGGGGAGGGKTMALLLQPIRHLHRPRFSAVIFRRTYPQITNAGGLWDQSREIYRYLKGVPREGYHDWIFPSGAKIRFAHMQREEDRYSWDGSEIPLICFDQAESFTWIQISYMFSRNRSTCGVKPYIRMTCNPNYDCWLREFLDWWIDDDSGLAIPHRSGKERYFVNIHDEIHWADTPIKLEEIFGADCAPRSVTFIPSSVYDNKILMDKNPNYLASLKALSRIDRERLLGCNWNTKESAGMFFQRSWFEIVPAAPAGVDIRYWDRAGTAAEDIKSKKASHTAGLLMTQASDGQWYIKGVDRFQGSPMEVMTRIKNVATQDGVQTDIWLEQDPGQAGKAEVQAQVRNLVGFNARVNAVHESKGIRAKPLSAQCEAGNVKLVAGNWVEKFLREAENFDGSKTCVSDQIDAASGAFLMHADNKRAGVWGT